MSSDNDINQLLGSIGSSARSASDPWTLSRSYRSTVARDSFRPAVVGDLGGTGQELDSSIDRSIKITEGNTVEAHPTSNPADAGTSTGSGLLGGLLNFFPLASGIAKLFGFGDDPSTPAPVPYELPPSISFEGAMSGTNSGVTSLSYGADGLPRTPAAGRQVSAASTPVTSPNMTPTGQPQAQPGSSDVFGQLAYLAQSTLAGPAERNSADSVSQQSGMAGQIGTLAQSTFASEPAASSPDFNVPLVSQEYTGKSDSVRSDRTRDSGTGASATNLTDTQQAHSILVQVQAMDSQSFMDHSQEIAQAVRQAMLNTNSLNDVILDL